MVNVLNDFIDQYMLCDSIESIGVISLCRFRNWPRLRAGAFLVRLPLRGGCVWGVAVPTPLAQIVTSELRGGCACKLDWSSGEFTAGRLCLRGELRARPCKMAVAAGYSRQGVGRR